MPAENVETARRIYAAMARGDFWALREHLDPEIVWEWSSNLAGLTGVSSYHGLEGVEAATRDFFEGLELFRQEAEEFIEAGDDVLVMTRTYSRPKGSERELEGRAAERWTFRDGKVVRFKLYDSRDEARAALGLAPQPPKDSRMDS